MYSTRYSCPVLMKYEFIDSFSKNTQISNSMKIRPLEAELLYALRRREGRTYMAELIFAFRNFSKAPKKLQITTIFPAVLPQISSQNSGLWCDAVQQDTGASSFSSTLHFWLYLSQTSIRTATFGNYKVICYLNRYIFRLYS